MDIDTPILNNATANTPSPGDNSTKVANTEFVQSEIDSLDTDDIPEGATNEYYTDARARASLSASSPVSYDSSTGDIGLSGVIDESNGGTGQSSFTDGQLLIGNSTGNGLTKSTLTAGDNVTITNSNGAIEISAAAAAGINTTDDLPEGVVNLYYTDSRADARISAQKAVANGLATLGSDGIVPGSQLPPIVAAVSSLNSMQGSLQVTATSPLSVNSGLGEIDISLPSTSDILCASFNSDHVIYGDYKAAFVVGGSATANAWNKRTINTTVSERDSSNSFSFASNSQISLTAGSYLVEARATAYTSGLAALRFYNVTDSSVSIMSMKSWINGLVQIPTYLVGEITLTSTKSFELQQYITYTQGGTQTLGVSGTQDGYYTLIKIVKLS